MGIDVRQYIHTRPYENIRLRVANLVMKATKEAINEVKEVVKGLGRYALEELENFINNMEYWQLIIPQEIGVDKGYVDMDLFNKIIFEIKGKETEFSKAYSKIVNDYLPSYPNAMYVIITNWDKWVIYEVEDNHLEEIHSIDIRKKGITYVQRILKNIVINVLRSEGYRLPPHPNVIARVFSDARKFEDKLLRVLDKVLHNRRIRPLYKVFSQIVRTLYGDAEEEFIKKLYIKHTVLQMIILASLSRVLNKRTDPVRMCSGVELDVEIALPYLNWWFIAYNYILDQRDRYIIEELSDWITSRVEIIDWKVLYVEDIFREFYELLIDRETRRSIGEYYTPLWIVEYVLATIKDLVGGLRDKLILDPFCGSGTFLVIAFHEKVREGEAPEKAIREVIGFDINPLAVSIARAELLLAYLRYSKSVEYVPKPLIFHVDSIHVMFREGIPNISRSARGTTLLDSISGERIEELEVIENKIIAPIVNRLARSPKEIKLNISENFSDLIFFEYLIASSLRIALHYCSNDRECLKDKIRSRIYDHLVEENMRSFMGSVLKDEILPRLDVFSEASAGLLSKYGNGVWASAIVSMLAPLIIKHVRADIVVTNPPWLQLTKFKAPYSTVIWRKAKQLVTQYAGVSRRADNVVKGSDLSSMALYGSLNLASKALGFVMPRKSSFYTRSSQRSGIILTYAVIKSFEDHIDEVTMIDLDYDAFQHGDIPSLVIIKMKEESTYEDKSL